MVTIKFFHVGDEDVKRHPLFDITCYQYLIIVLRLPIHADKRL